MHGRIALKVTLVVLLGITAGVVLVQRRPFGHTTQQALAYPPAAQAASPANKPKRSPRAEEFQRIHGEMNALLAELAQLQIRYRTADDEKRTEIQQQWKDLIAQGEAIGPKLIEAGEKAYAEAPNADPQITDFLARQMLLKVQRDDFDPAFEIGKLLMDHDCQIKQVPALAGVAAMAVSEFDAAEQYFKQAALRGESLNWGRDRESLDQLVKWYLANPQYFKQSWAREKAIRQRETEAGSLPRVLLKTTKGDIVVELFENEAPKTVGNFVSLVERGFYKDTPFHRVEAGFVAQGGDPQGAGSGGPGYSIPCECYEPNHRDHFRGSLSMAHAGRDTGGSQFFIAFVPAVSLNGRHTVFGRVVSGMDVLAKLQRRDPNDKEAPRADKIIEAKVLRKRPHKYAPVKMPD
jgi:cyclophilin family peptidyl-prolyl cis-trans isomerase